MVILVAIRVSEQVGFKNDNFYGINLIVFYNISPRSVVLCEQMENGMKKILMMLTLLLSSVQGYANEDVEVAGYVSSIIGVNFLDFDTPLKPDTHPGFVLGVSSGVKLDNWFRIESEITFRRNSIKYDLTDGIDTVNFKGTNYITTVMFNGIWELVQNCMFTPYVGGGIGYAAVSHMAADDDFFLGNQSDNFAWQVITGISYPLDDVSDVALEYRYLVPTSKLVNHDLVFAVKRYF